MAIREAGDWLSSYLEYTDNTEPPASYHLWTGISVISGVLQRKVWMEGGHELIYPNMYVVLIGPSGRCRKGTAMNIGKGLLKTIKEVTLTSESITREALIRVMKNASSTMIDPSNPSITKLHCSVTVLSEELSVFLGQNDLKFLSNLTDWYDCKDRWAYDTIGRGRDFINGVCFNFCAATAPDWLQSILPQEAIGGGYTSRNIYICEEVKGQTSPKHTLSATQVRLREMLVNDLGRINTLAGEYKFTPDGEKAYVDWYTIYDKALARGEYPVEDPRFAYYAERRATHIRKLMMILSAARGDTMKMTSQDFDRANKLLKAAELKMHRTFGGLGRAQGAIDAH